MSEQKFKSLMMRAQALYQSDRPDYYAGYQRGLRRAYHGDNFGTEQEHELWLLLVDSPYADRHERGLGYVDGLAAIDGDDRPGIPSAGAVHAYLQSNSITGAQAARMMYLSGSRQVRKYTGGEKPRQMDAARWFCLHAHVMLSDDVIAKIESAMESDLNPE